MPKTRGVSTVEDFAAAATVAERPAAADTKGNINLRIEAGTRQTIEVDSPIGINRRSSLDLTNKLSTEFDGIIHWAHDTQK